MMYFELPSCRRLSTFCYMALSLKIISTQFRKTISLKRRVLVSEKVGLLMEVQRRNHCVKTSEKLK